MDDVLEVEMECKYIVVVESWLDELVHRRRLLA
jgi:hypothetical protein